MVETAVKRVDAGLSTRADEIAKLDDISIDDAKLKVKEIDDEVEPSLPVITNNTNGNAGDPGTSNQNEPNTAEE
jgi:hypothetical protein